MKNSKQMMYDDLFFAPVCIWLGYFGITHDHTVAGVLLIFFGALWLSVRLYHLTHQK